jgi:hypothetical protein
VIADSRDQIALYDGIGTSTSTGFVADGNWHWLTLTRTIDLSATELTFRMLINNGNTAYYSGPTLVLGPIPPAYYQPTPSHYETLRFHTYGATTAGADKWHGSFSRPGIVKDIQLSTTTAPAGAARARGRRRGSP